MKKVKCTLLQRHPKLPYKFGNLPKMYLYKFCNVPKMCVQIWKLPKFTTNFKARPYFGNSQICTYKFGNLPKNVHVLIWDLPKWSKAFKFIVNFGNFRICSYIFGRLPNLYAYISGKLPNLYSNFGCLWRSVHFRQLAKFVCFVKRS